MNAQALAEKRWGKELRRRAIHKIIARHGPRHKPFKLTVWKPEDVVVVSAPAPIFKQPKERLWGKVRDAFKRRFFNRKTGQ